MIFENTISVSEWLHYVRELLSSPVLLQSFVEKLMLSYTGTTNQDFRTLNNSDWHYFQSLQINENISNSMSKENIEIQAKKIVYCILMSYNNTKIIYAFNSVDKTDSLCDFVYK